MVKSPLYSAFFFSHTQFFISLLSHLFSQVEGFELEPTPRCLGGRQTQRNSSPLHHHSFSVEEGWFTDLCGLYHQLATSSPWVTHQGQPYTCSWEQWCDTGRAYESGHTITWVCDARCLSWDLVQRTLLQSHVQCAQCEAGKYLGRLCNCLSAAAVLLFS